MKLKDQVVVITGSTRGIGRAIARACAQEGARIIISSRHEKAVKETCETFQKENFTLSDTLPLKKGTFLTKIPSFQNLKMAIYKGFVI